MKRMKKLVSLMLAMVMVLAMAVTTFAEETGTGKITINGTTKDRVYDIYKIFDMTQDSATAANVAYTIDSDWTAFFESTGAGYILAAQPEGGSLNQVVVDGVVKYINITDDNVAEFAQAALAFAASKTADETVTETDENKTIEIEGLELGYYLVYPQGATEITSGNASICSLTSTDPDATVNVKATYPTIEKEDDSVSADIGDTVNYTITGKVPDTTGYATYKYIVHDTMSDGLTFDGQTSVIVTVDKTDVTAACTYTEGSNGFSIQIPVKNYTVGADIVVTYTATVNEQAICQVEKNRAYLEYSNDPSDVTKTTTTPVDEEEVYNCKIVIDKIETGKENVKLAGAEFVLKNADDKFYQWDETEKEVNWVDSQDSATVATTGSDGAAEFKGLKNATYNLVEIKAPAGYNLLTTPVEVVVDGGNNEVVAADYSVVAQVANNTGTTLPETGGMGTTVIYIAGGVLVLAALVLLFAKRRMSKEA